MAGDLSVGTHPELVAETVCSAVQSSGTLNVRGTAMSSASLGSRPTGAYYSCGEKVFHFVIIDVRIRCDTHDCTEAAMSGHPGP